MLDWSATQRFATQNGPLAGERRLCMFARPRTGSPGAPGSPDDDETPEQNEELLAAETREMLKKQLVESDLAAVRSQVFEMMEHEPGKAEALLQKTAKVQKFMTEVYDIPGLEFRLPSGELTNLRHHLINNDKKMLDETMNFLQPQMETSAKMRAIAEILAEWERGELQLEEFKNKISPLTPPDTVDDITQADIDKWKTANPAERMKLREEINNRIELEKILDKMMQEVDSMQKIHEHVKHELLGAMPKQQIIDDSTAVQIKQSLATTFEKWDAGSMKLEELRIQAEPAYRAAGVPGTDERLREIEKAIAKIAATDDEKKKKEIHALVVVDVKDVKNFMQRKLGQWAQQKFDAIHRWEQGLVSNSEFAEIMKHVYATEGGDDVQQKLDAITQFVSTHGNTWSGNASDRIEVQEDLKRVINLRGTYKWLTRWCEKAKPEPQTQTAGAGAPPSAPTATAAGAAGGPPEKPKEKKEDPKPPKGGEPADGDDGSENDGSGGESGDREKPKLDEPANIDPVALQAHHGGFFRQYGIEFYSINDMIGGFKRVIDAYKHGFHERTVLKETAFASALGKAIPGWTYLSGEVKLTVEKAADSEKDKETREFKEYLEERHFTFTELFEGHGEVSMAHLQAEPPKARAVLEYAASRGWLYDVNAAQSQHKFQILGYDLKNICSDWGEGPDAKRKRENYFIKLAGTNASGVKSEISHGKEKEHYTDKAHLFIQAINHALDEKNYWEAVGIAQRSIERGLAGEISPWIAITVMRRLREDASARKYITDQILDQFGLIGFVHTARTLGALKVGRKGIGEWSKDPSKDFGEIDREHHGVCYYYIQIENRIKKLSGEKFESMEDKRKLDQMVAKVLAAELVPVGGTFISIFDKEFFPYAEEIIKMNQQGESHSKDEDDDYYNNVSDVILADREVFKSIFLLSGSGKFSNNPKPNFLLNTMLNHYGVLQQHGSPEAAKNYKKLASEKFNYWIEFWIRENRGGPAYTEQMPRPVMIDGIKVEYAILALIQADFIEFETIKKYCKQISKTSVILAQGIMEQLANLDGKTPNKYQAEARAHLASLGGAKD